MKIKRLLFLTLLTAVCLFMPVSLAYFDTLSPSSSDNVSVGRWGYKYDNIPVNGEDVMKLIDSTFFDSGSNQFLKDSFFHEVSGSQILDSQYSNYLMKDMRNLVTLTDQFRSDFLSPNGGAYVLTTTEKLVPLDPATIGSFLPGDCQQILGLIHTADLAPSQTLEIVISMEAGNKNFYDFALEIFFDSNVLSSSNLFTYAYNITDYDITNSYTQLSSLTVTEGTFRTCYKNNKIDYYYDHQIMVPTYPGSWSRFTAGPRYYPMAVNSKFKNYQSESDPTEQNGLILIGKGKGNIAQMRIQISNRLLHFPSETSPIIPIIINITRGLPSSGSPSAVATTPIIKFGIKKG
jgi:hypothetical protein